MSRPPWNPSTDEERAAFINRVHDELMIERMKDGQANVERLDDLIFHIEAARRGYSMKGGKRGRKFQLDANAPLEQAKHDAKRLGMVFRRLWQKSNRQSDPSVSAILTAIWGLSDADRAKLETYLSHKSVENG